MPAAIVVLWLAGADPTYTLSWAAPGGCPEGPEVTAQIGALLEGHAGDGVHVAASAEVEAIAGGFSLTLVTSTVTGSRQRVIEASRCDELASVTALLVAIAVDDGVTAATGAAGDASEEPGAAAATSAGRSTTEEPADEPGPAARAPTPEASESAVNAQNAQGTRGVRGAQEGQGRRRADGAPIAKLMPKKQALQGPGAHAPEGPGIERAHGHGGTQERVASPYH